MNENEYTTAPNFDNCPTGNSCNAGSNYSVAYYVEDYIDRLGVEAIGRLLTYPEAKTMTQNQRNNGQYYWLGSAVASGSVRIVANYGNVGSSYDTFGSTGYDGVRPVIVVNTSDIQSS